MGRRSGHRAPVPLLGLLLVVGMLACSSAPPPNVVLIVIDTLRRDHTGFHGHSAPTTPRLDALAEHSLVVEDAGANAPWTKPAIATLFTSLMPAEHQAIHEPPQSRLGESHRTLAEVFRDAGYRTAAFSENPNVHTKTGFAQGFEHFRDPKSWLRRPKNSSVQKASEWLREGGEPFFLYLHFLDPHGPYHPPQALRQQFTRGQRSQIDYVRRGLVSFINMSMDPTTLAPHDVAFLRSLYDAEIRFVDGEIGALLDGIADLGRAKRTIVLVTSDHGEEFLENDRLAHGPWMSEELLRIPLLLHVPGAGARRVDATGISQIDIAPTLVELAGLAIPGTFRGRSFAPLVHGAAPTERSVLAETHNAGTHRRSVREGRWKLVRDELAGTQRLHDLASDPGEERDLAGERPEVVARLAGQLAEVAVAGPVLRDEARGEADPALESQLRALGYLGDEEAPDAPPPR